MSDKAPPVRGDSLPETTAGESDTSRDLAPAPNHAPTMFPGVGCSECGAASGGAELCPRCETAELRRREALGFDVPTVGGIGRGAWNETVEGQIAASCGGNVTAAQEAIRNIAPADADEGMLASLMVAAHSAAHDCYGRAARHRRARRRPCALARERERRNQADPHGRGAGGRVGPAPREVGTADRPRRACHGERRRAGHRRQCRGPGEGGGVSAESANDAMRLDLLALMRAAPRCGARTRSGTPCKAPAMPNGRCRLHGGHSRGGPPGNRHAWKHGRIQC